MFDKFKNQDNAYNNKKVFFGVMGAVAVVTGIIIASRSNSNNLPDFSKIASLANEAVVGGSKVTYESVEELAGAIRSSTSEITQFEFSDLVSELPFNISGDDLLDALSSANVVITDT